MLDPSGYDPTQPPVDPVRQYAPPPVASPSLVAPDQTAQQMQMIQAIIAGGQPANDRANAGLQEAINRRQNPQGGPLGQAQYNDGVYHGGAGQPTPMPNPTGGGGDFKSFRNAIAQQESGDYNGLGQMVNGDRAYGKYQIMGNNIPEWSREALGYSVSPQQFEASPQLQEAIATYKLQQYYNQFGAGGAAQAWYGGPGSVNVNSNAPQHVDNSFANYPSLNEYRDSILRRMTGG